jgi:hypothetical protein
MGRELLAAHPLDLLLLPRQIAAVFDVDLGGLPHGGGQGGVGQAQPDQIGCCGNRAGAAGRPG